MIRYARGKHSPPQTPVRLGITYSNSPGDPGLLESKRSGRGGGGLENWHGCHSGQQVDLPYHLLFITSWLVGQSRSEVGSPSSAYE